MSNRTLPEDTPLPVVPHHIPVTAEEIHDEEKFVKQNADRAFLSGPNWRTKDFSLLVGAIRDFIRGDQPASIHREVAELLGKNGDELIDQIYTKPFPNRYCAQFCKYVGDNRHRDPYFRDLLLNSFRNFFTNIVCHYPDYRSYKLNCVGSVGFFYRDLLQVAAEEAGMELGRIIRAPLEDLVKYHLA